MERDELLQVGVITTAHGIKGQVNVFPTTDDAKRFKKLKSVILDKKGQLSEVKVEQTAFFKNMVILKLEGIDDRNAAETLKKCPLLVTRENAVPLDADEYFVADLIGLDVFENETDALIGKITDVISTGANDVYEIAIDKDFIYNGKRPDEAKIYAPAIKACITDVNISEGKVSMTVMPGLIE